MEIDSMDISDSSYPRLLKEIFDAPRKIYFAGDISVLEKPCIGIVGTRRASTHGENLAFNWAKDLSRRGYCVVSGLAYGIDAAAHRGALEGQGGTVAVVAQGLPEISPARHRKLAERIVTGGGLLLSERPMGYEINKTDFLVRNRLISGLSKGIVVIEAGFKSGALNTANHAGEQGRELMAVPGQVGDPNSEGCLNLIYKGATMVRSSKDIAEYLGLAWQKVDLNQLKGMTKDVFVLLSKNPMSGPELGEQFKGQLKDLYVVLGEMELNGLIRMGNGRRYGICSHV